MDFELKRAYKVDVLFEGHSNTISDTETSCNCSCTLLRGPQTIIVDTMTVWDGSRILQALKTKNLTPEDITWVISTHGHSDHIGCNYLFQKAKHVVGFDVSEKTRYFSHDFRSGKELIIDENLRIVPTPGHTLQHVSVVVKSENRGTVVVAGDLFENEKDLEDENVWISAGSDSEDLQRKNRQKILEIADYIVPGHGPMFKVNK